MVLVVEHDECSGQGAGSQLPTALEHSPGLVVRPSRGSSPSTWLLPSKESSPSTRPAPTTPLSSGAVTGPRVKPQSRLAVYSDRCTSSVKSSETPKQDIPKHRSCSMPCSMLSRSCATTSRGTRSQWLPRIHWGQSSRTEKALGALSSGRWSWRSLICTLSATRRSKARRSLTLWQSGRPSPRSTKKKFPPIPGTMHPGTGLCTSTVPSR